MLLNHSQSFAQFQPAQIRDTPPSLPLPKRQEISAFKSGTMLETPSGWRPVETLCKGDQVYTLDGGFAEITNTRQRRLPTGAGRHIHVPAGSLNNCSDLFLTAGQHVAMINAECETLFHAPCVLVPAAAMLGYRGIAAITGYSDANATELFFATEEIVYAQTGALLHVASEEPNSFFRTLGYGETRALLSLINKGHCGLDTDGYAPAQAA